MNLLPLEFNNEDGFISSTTWQAPPEDPLHGPLRLCHSDREGLLTAALESGRVVDTCEWTVSGRFLLLNPHEVYKDNSIFRRVCRLPGLKNVGFLNQSFMSDDQICPCPSHVLSLILEQIPGLKTLSLDLVVVSGSQVENDRFLRNLASHPSLEVLGNFQSHRTHASNLRIGIDPLIAHASNLRIGIDPLIASLSNLASLKEVHVTAARKDRWERLSLDSLPQLCSLGTLEKLQLECFNFTQDHVLTLFQDLKDNPNGHLKVVFLSFCPMTNAVLEGTAGMLANNQSLTSFSLGFETRTWYSSALLWYSSALLLEHDDGFVGIFQALRDNATLKNLQLFHGRPGTSYAPRLRHSSLFSRLDLLARLASPPAFVELVKHNMTLETVPEFGTDIAIHEEVEFYLTLNRMGRKHLFRGDFTKEQWFHYILQAKDDLSFLYYFLSLKPELLGGV